MITVRHNKIDLAVHELQRGEGRPLLLLHGLGGRTPTQTPGWAEPWPGPVLGLDFTGHGHSTLPAGGGYSCEMLMADVDAALAHLGAATLAGQGLGGYIALLIAGGRPQLVRGAVIADGPGLVGGGPAPASMAVVGIDDHEVGPPDPWAYLELTRDVRPPDYASAFARQALQLSGLDTPLVVAARVRPPWLEAVASEPGVVTLPLERALALFARS
jgi:pimeloyl-ACP methyl ester carboxylesterase